VLPSFALVQSIFPGELLSFVVVLELGLELVLVLASLLKNNLISLRCSCRGEYFRPERPAGVAATPQPKQRSAFAVLMKGGAGSSFTPVQRKIADQHAARAAVAHLPAGKALKSASSPATSRKRKHQYSIKQVGRSNNGADVRQQQRDANDIVDNLFATTKDNPERMKATLKRVVEHTALQEHLPAELTVKHTQTQRVAKQLGTNLQRSYKVIAAKGSAATGAELNMRRAGMQMVLTGNEAEKRVRLLASAPMAPRPRFSLCPRPPLASP
jgi:hypothetical protein